MTDITQPIRDALNDYAEADGALEVAQAKFVLVEACRPTALIEVLARLDATELDAARYRRLRGQELHDPAIYIGVDGIDFKNRWALGAGDETKTDAAIDAAMKGKP